MLNEFRDRDGIWLSDKSANIDPMTAPPSALNKALTECHGIIAVEYPESRRGTGLAIQVSESIKEAAVKRDFLIVWRDGRASILGA